MIKLEVEEYCDDCPEFDAHVEKEVLFAGYSKKYCNTNITCEHKDKCKRLKDMIEKEAKKRNDLIRNCGSGQSRADEVYYRRYAKSYEFMGEE